MTARPPLIMQGYEVGGGFVRRGFKTGTGWRRPGERLSVAELAAMSRANLNAMVEKHIIDVFPKAAHGSDGDGDKQRFMISTGFGKYNVVEGVMLNDEPLSKDEAQELAGIDSGKKGKH